MSKVTKRPLSEWVREHMETHGREWVASHYEQACSDLGRRIPYSSYSRTIRFAARTFGESGGSDLESHEVASEAESIDFHGVDLLQWQPKRLTTNTWGSEANPNRQVKVEYGQREPSPEEFADRFRALAEQYDPPAYAPIDRPATRAGLTCEVGIFDLHLAKEVWGLAVNGPDYSARIARDLFADAVGSLMAGYSRNQFDRVLFPVGNDFIHYDNIQQTTTAGTPQAGGPNPLLAFDMGITALVSAIDSLTVYGPVDVPVVPGNHDRTVMYLLGRLLEAWYRNNPNVRIDAGPDPYKWRAAGSWMIGYHHGKEWQGKALKPDRLAFAMADEAPELWAASRHREMHVGHFHQAGSTGYRSSTEAHGVRVVVFPSLSPADEWHRANGYKGEREAVANVLTDEKGVAETRRFRP